MLSLIVGQFFGILSTLIVIYILLSWFVRDAYSPLYKIYSFLGVVSEPILSPFRALLSRFTGQMGIDFSPILAILALRMLGSAVVQLLRQMGL